MIRPVTVWAAIPAIGKLTKPAVHHSQLLTSKRRESAMACPTVRVAAMLVRLPAALVGSVVMVCPRWYSVLEPVKGGPV